MNVDQKYQMMYQILHRYWMHKDIGCTETSVNQLIATKRKRMESPYPSRKKR
jgi:hypothetical protein